MPFHSPDHSHLSYDTRQAIERATTRLLKDALWAIAQQEVASFEELSDRIRETCHDDCLAISLSLDERLTLVEEHLDDYGLELDVSDMTQLRTRIDSMAALIIGLMGEEQALAAIATAEDLVEELDLDFDALIDGSPYGMFRHYAEREQDPWYVYEYRNLEGEGIHADIFELRVAGITLTVRHYLARGTLSREEERWDAM